MGNFIYVHPWTRLFDLRGRADIPKSYGSHILMRNCDVTCTRKPCDIVYENIKINDQSQQQNRR